MHSRLLLLGDPNARPEGLERALVRAGFSLAEADRLPSSPGDCGSPDLTLVTIGQVDGELDQRLLPVTQEAWRAVPTIVVLPVGASEAAGRALALGAQDAMVAPIHIPELCARVVARLRGVRDGFRAAASSRGQAQLFAVFQGVALAARPEEMLQILVSGLARSLGAAHCACIFTIEGRRGRVVAVAEKPEIRNAEVGLDDYPEVRHAATTGRTAFIPDVALHPLFAAGASPRPELAPFPPTSAVAVPIAFQGKTIGFIMVRTAISQANLTVDDVAFIETLVTATSRLLEHEDRRATLYRRQASSGVVDPLTGCGGLDALDRRVQDEMQRAVRYGRRLSLAIIDVDGLRFLNQRLGIATGDRVLTELGGLLQRELRAPDYVARYGGDEFALVLPETEASGAVGTIERVRAAIAAHPFADGIAERIQISAGWAGFPSEGTLSPEDLLSRAEASLVEAKRQATGTAA